MNRSCSQIHWENSSDGTCISPFFGRGVSNSGAVRFPHDLTDLTLPCKARHTLPVATLRQLEIRLQELDELINFLGCFDGGPEPPSSSCRDGSTLGPFQETRDWSSPIDKGFQSLVGRQLIAYTLTCGVKASLVFGRPMGEKSNVIHTLVMACLSTLLPRAHNMIGLPCRDSPPALLSRMQLFRSWVARRDGIG